MKHGLTDKHLLEIKSILAPYQDKIEQVSLYGSRAQGVYRDNSDIDIALIGDISEKDIKRLQMDFEDSNIPYLVDICCLSLLKHKPLVDNILSDQQILFTEMTNR